MKDKTFSRRMTIGCGLGMAAVLLAALCFGDPPARTPNIPFSIDPSAAQSAPMMSVTTDDVQWMVIEGLDGYSFATGYQQPDTPHSITVELTTSDGEVWEAIWSSKDGEAVTDAAKVTADAAVDTAAQIFPEIEE